MLIIAMVSFTACDTLLERPEQNTSTHLQEAQKSVLRAQTVLPPPEPAAHEPIAPQPAAKYDVAVKNVAVQELLYALARDSRINIDIHPAISGYVTLNAAAQTLPQLLTRITRQVSMRWEIDDGCFVVLPDTPFIRHYRVDYINMNRDTIGAIAVSSQMNSTTGNSEGVGDSNHSLTRIESRATNQFWKSLVENIKSIVEEPGRLVKTSSTIKEKSAETVTAQETRPKPTTKEEGKRMRQQRKKSYPLSPNRHLRK